MVLLAQQKDSRTREYITPTRIVWQQNSEQISDSENLLQAGIGQSVLANSRVCVMKSEGDKHPAILLDFGKQLQGGLQIVTGTHPNQPIKMRIRFGESVSEAMCDIDGRNGATNDHAMRDFVADLPWLGVYETSNSGFRFARIDLLSENATVHLKEIRAVSIYRDIPYLGSFESNDDALNQIWKTGAYTVHLNMQEYLWDGIKRDRLVWIGDLHPEVMTVSSVFGYNDVVPKSLDLIRDITPPREWMNGISSYSLWWILIHRDWYYYQGNLDYLKQQRPYLNELLARIIETINKSKDMIIDGHRFLDWPSSENPSAVNAGLLALQHQTMQAGEELCTVLGDKEMAEQCKQMADKLANNASAFTTSLDQSTLKPYDNGQKQAASLLSLAGLMDAKKADSSYISVNGAHGFSTFYGYYMLRAMAKAHNYSGAMDIIRSYWGAMIDLGATTFWEDFNLKWLDNAARIDELVPDGKIDIHGSYGAYCYKNFRHSLCHGWASGPTAWLSEYVLGVQVLEPGCKVVRISPNLGDLEWVKGSFPTPHGVIEIHHTKDSKGRVKSSIKAPKGVKIIKAKAGDTI